jgi:DUF971 family protein
MSEPWPEEFRLSDGGRTLFALFDSGERFSYPAEYLRVESPSAEVKGHGPGQEVIVTGKADVNIVKIEPVGNYAVRFHFNDGHSTGLYTWTYLVKLGREKEALWSAYLEKLSSIGGKRKA